MSDTSEYITNAILFDEVGDNVVTEMKDDGLYNISGDNIQNDGIFSCKLNIDL